MNRERKSSVIPYGWRLSDAAPRILEPVEEEQEALKQALDYVTRGSSMREVARWLSAVTGRYLSNNGLKLIYQRERG